MHFTFPSIVALVGAVACNLAAAIDPSVVRKTCEAIASSVSSESAVYYVGKIIVRLSLTIAYLPAFQAINTRMIYTTGQSAVRS